MVAELPFFGEHLIVSATETNIMQMQPLKLVCKNKCSIKYLAEPVYKFFEKYSSRSSI